MPTPIIDPLPGPNDDEPDPVGPGPLPVEPDEGTVPPFIPDDPEHERIVDADADATLSPQAPRTRPHVEVGGSP